MLWTSFRTSFFARTGVGADFFFAGFVGLILFLQKFIHGGEKLFDINRLVQDRDAVLTRFLRRFLTGIAGQQSCLDTRFLLASVLDYLESRVLLLQGIIAQ